MVQLSGAAAYPLLVDKAAAAGKSAPLQVAALVSDLRWQQLVAREKLVLLLVSELLKGEESKWQPFIQHLLSCTTVKNPADANAQEYQDFCDNLVDASVQVRPSPSKTTNHTTKGITNKRASLLPRRWSVAPFSWQARRWHNLQWRVAPVAVAVARAEVACYHAWAPSLCLASPSSTRQHRRVRTAPLRQCGECAWCVG